MSYWRNHILFGCFIAMLVSLFISRGILSVSMILFVVTAFAHRDIRKHFLQFFSTPLLWGMSLLFLFPLISGLWSEDKATWLAMIRIKLPLCFLPLAFAGPVYFSKQNWEWLIYIFIGVITAGTVWSMVHYVTDIAVINESYLKAKSIVTVLENDHVRFSWLVSLAALLAGWTCIIKWKAGRLLSWTMLLLMVWLLIYLHILAARTGLFSFYIMLLVLSLWLIVKKMNWQYGAALLISLLILPFLAYYTLPSFQNRVKYIRYDLGYFKEANYLPGANDAVRVISLKAGVSLMKDNPVSGVGFGDIAAATGKWYDSAYPGMRIQDRIYPSSEWLMYGAGTGISGFLLFTFYMLVPFFTNTNNRLLWWLLNGTAAFSFLFDIGLEVQFGVFIYSFLVLWWYKWLNSEMSHKKM